MLRYLLKRLIILLPVVLIASVLAFVITTLNVKDIIDTRIQAAAPERFYHYESLYQKEYEELGFNKPLFYFNVESAIVPDSLFCIANDNERRHIIDLCYTYHDAKGVVEFIDSVRNWKACCIAAGSTDSIDEDWWIYGCRTADTLLHSIDVASTLESMRKTYRVVEGDTRFMKIYNMGMSLTLNARKNAYIRYIPVIYWHGRACMFNDWFMGVLTGNMGKSYTDNKAVGTKIREAFPVTLLISGISLCLLFAIGIFIGVYYSLHRQSIVGRVMGPFLMFLHSIPNYTFALWCIILFSCGGLLCWLPSGGLGEDSMTVIEKLRYLVLPVLCWVLPLLSVVVMHTAAAHTEVMNMPFILAARAKGANGWQVVNHTLKPALLPIIALGGLMAPVALSGSVLIETLFSLPGLGKLTFDALLSRDVPVVLATTILSVAVTVLVQLAADLLTFIIDPRTRQA